MNEQHRTKAERAATMDLLKFIEENFADLPVRVVAGALMQTSLALAIQALGPDVGVKATRRALDNITLHQRTTRTIQ